jgi:hypothetical protein
MAQNEVTAVAGACGHGGDDPACECWGVWGENRDGGQWMALSCVSANHRTGYVAAYGEAVLYRQGRMGKTMSFRVKRYPASANVMCGECRSSPCDCSKPIWSWRYRSNEYPAGAWRRSHGGPHGERRSDIVRLHADEAPYGVERGPIQRITDPPYEFLSPATRELLLGNCNFCGAFSSVEDVCCDALRIWRMEAGAPRVRCKHTANDPACTCWQVWLPTTPPMKSVSFGDGNFAQARTYVAMYSDSAKRVVRERPDIRLDTHPEHPMVVSYPLKWHIDPPNATSATSDSAASRMNEPVAECGHKLDSESCRCWGVRVPPNRDGVEWVTLSTGGERCNWSHADKIRTALQSHYQKMYLVSRHGYAPKPMCSATPAHKCALEWCNVQTTDPVCSSRCADYYERVRVLTDRYNVFERRMRSDGTLKSESDILGRADEVEWARVQTAADIAALERSWRAVQHENAVGDERFFKLLDDEEV